ncbi:YceI family protein [Aquimarina sp. 2201CG14-23]|uniref:YceI family protein n=1 Tax=Aquimarina mycalae TaxID=3040073 RepID=UPI0024780E21|nr:YceI family protein [Aquimarina sp. 2201CG14-23]MDH7444471.1 YceI family protein [Aquimarina sp. 2201CG14-23]
MKTKLMNLFAFIAIIASTVACKGDKKNDTEASAAEEVVEAPATAETYVVDNATSVIEWTGKKPVGQHTGTISLSKGSLKTLDGKIQSGSFVIDMNTINVTDLEGDEKAGLEGHLKGASEESQDHFFNVAKFPQASFDVTGISEKEGKMYIEGNLTIKGIKKNISFPATANTEGDVMTLTTDIFTINRTDWGVNYASKSIFTDIGDKFINDDIELKISLKAKKA